jgi:cytochrome c-type biogenesis protein CcmF
MEAEIGQFSLVLALVISAVQAIVPHIGAQRRNLNMIAFANHAACMQFLFVAVAFACLTYGFVTSDFSMLIVTMNSNSTMPDLFKFTAVWGNHEGSLLLWILILTLFGVAVALTGRNLPITLKARVLAIQSAIAFGFLALIIFTSNPFERMFPAALDGQELNPLLQDIGLAIHPPFLYLGYVGFSITFAFAVAALLEGRIDASWARFVRPWVLAAWCFLTIGIISGTNVWLK